MSFERKLRALGYPTPLAGADLTSLASSALRTLVVWLEFTKIRFYPVAQRADLKAVEAANWTATFSRYLDDLECPRAHSPQDMNQEQVASVVEWLLSQAIGAEYSDHAAELNSLSRVSFLGKSTSAASQTTTTPVLDCTSPAVRAALEEEVSQLAQLFRLPFDSSQLASILRVIRKRVEESMLAAAAEQGQGLAPAPTSSAATAASSTAAPTTAASASSSFSSSSGPAAKSAKATRFMHAIPQTALPQTREEVFAILDRMDLGFQSTGDSLVDHAAQVFRLLFLHDLRTTQNLANELMVLAQEYTSDPKTDAKLGAVGR